MTTNKPQPQIVTIWRIVLVLVTIVPAFLTSVILRLGSNVWIAATCVWAVAFLGMYLVYFPMLYKRFAFRLDAQKIILNTGVFTHRTVAIPLSAIQYTTVTQNVFGRMFGLSSVIVTAPGGRMVIQGLKTADAMALAAALKE